MIEPNKYSAHQAHIRPYLIGVPVITLLYLVGILLVRGADTWITSPTILHGITLISKVFYAPVVHLWKSLPGRNALGGVMAVLTSGCLWGFAIVWLWQLVIKIKNK